MNKILKVSLYVVSSGALATLIEAVLQGMEHAQVGNYALMGALNMALLLLVRHKDVLKR